MVAIFGGGEPPAEAHWMLGEPDLPGGIDYERWTPLVAPAPREAFADRLDLVEFFDD